MIIIWLLAAFGAGFFVGGRTLGKKLSPVFKQVEELPENLENFARLPSDKQTEFIAELKRERDKEYAGR